MMMISLIRKAVIVLCCVLVMQCRSDTVTDGESEAAARVVLYKVSKIVQQKQVNNTVVYVDWNLTVVYCI